MKKCSRCKHIMDEIFFIRREKEFSKCNKCADYNKKYHKTYGLIYRQNNKEKISIKNKEIYIKAVNENPYIRNFYRAKQRSKKKNLDFNISIDYLRSIYPDNNMCPCFMVQMIHNTNYAPSLDRINPKLGYIEGNVQFISKRANELKSDATTDEIEKIIDYIANNGNSINTNIKYYENINQYIMRRLKEIKSRAKQAGIEYNLNIKNIQIPIKCQVLGIDLINSAHNDPRLPSFDRINPDIGYIISNTRVISKRANSIKRDGKLEEFQLLLKFMRNK